MGGSTDRRGTCKQAPGALGTCSEMCPVEECYERERCYGLSVFEVLSAEDTGGWRVDCAKAVKKYKRPTAGAQSPQPGELRTLPALQKTMEHLLGVLDRTDVSFLEACDFVRDRTRAVRQDLVLQGIRGHCCVEIYEAIVRFHIMCAYELCGYSKAEFDAYQNMEQLQTTLQTVLGMYGEFPGCENEGEFYGYFLLANLRGKESAEKVSRKVGLAEVHRLLAVYVFYKQGNFRGFFRSVRERATTYLEGCVLHGVFPSVRVWAWECFRKAYRSGEISGEAVAKELGLGEEGLLDGLGDFFVLRDTKVFWSGRSSEEVPEVFQKDEKLIGAKRAGQYSEILAKKGVGRVPAPLKEAAPLAEERKAKVDRKLFAERISQYIRDEVVQRGTKIICENLLAQRRRRNWLARQALRVWRQCREARRGCVRISRPEGTHGVLSIPEGTSVSLCVCLLVDGEKKKWAQEKFGLCETGELRRPWRNGWVFSWEHCEKYIFTHFVVVCETIDCFLSLPKPELHGEGCVAVVWSEFRSGVCGVTEIALTRREGWRRWEERLESELGCVLCQRGLPEYFLGEFSSAFLPVFQRTVLDRVYKRLAEIPEAIEDGDTVRCCVELYNGLVSVFDRQNNRKIHPATAACPRRGLSRLLFAEKAFPSFNGFLRSVERAVSQGGLFCWTAEILDSDVSDFFLSSIDQSPCL
ncbi:MAG: nuclear export factor Sac3 [Amphiamblys sp. WSBS2006]|nr:MAG: nuclear export factor Sac3 [Amphiamblys sp. WSBS2006]